MITQCYTVLDKKVGNYGTPFFAINDDVAVRSFSQVANDHNTTIYQYPEDFDLYQIGSVDLDSGVMQSLDKPFWIASAVAVTQERRLTREAQRSAAAQMDFASKSESE